MKHKTHLGGAIAVAIILLGIAGGPVKADEILETKTTQYLGVAEQTILPDSSFYPSKNLSRRLDRFTSFNATDRVTIDLEKLSELVRELADIHFNGANKSWESKVYDLYADWSSYLALDYAKASNANGGSLNNGLEASIDKESLKQLVVLNELEKNGLDPMIASSFRKIIIQNWALSLGKLGNSQWTAITLETAKKLEATITNKDMLDMLDVVALTVEKTPLSNLVKGVIINLAGLGA